MNPSICLDFHLFYHVIWSDADLCAILFVTIPSSAIIFVAVLFVVVWCFLVWFDEIWFLFD